MPWEQKERSVGEWLEVGQDPHPDQPGSWRRLALIAAPVIIVLTMIAVGVLAVRPSWRADHQTLTVDQVAAGFDGLAIVNDVITRSDLADLRIGVGDCGLLLGPSEVSDLTHSASLPGVTVLVTVGDDNTTVYLTTVVLADPRAARERVARIERVLRDPICLDPARSGKAMAGSGPQPARRLGYRLEVRGEQDGQPLVDWWSDVVVLRFGNTVTMGRSTGPADAPDVLTPVLDQLDQGFRTAGASY